MTLLQPEEDAWGSAYLALLAAGQAGESSEVQELLLSGAVPSTVRILYPLDRMLFTVQLAACAPLGSVGLDLLESLNYRYGQFSQSSMKTTYYKIMSEGRERMTDWQRGYRAVQAAYPKPVNFGGRRSSLFLMYRITSILDRWSQLTWEERGEVYGICIQIDEVLASDPDASLGYSAAKWLSVQD